MRAVPVLIRDFRLQFGSAPSPAKGKKRGRKSGDGSLDDDPLIKRALKMMAAKEVRNAFHAATLLALEAPGGGSEDSKRARLYKKIKAAQ